MRAGRVLANIAEAVEGLLDNGSHPIAVRLSVADYKALLSKNGLEQRSIKVTNPDSLRARVHGFDLPVDADRRVPFDDAWVQAVCLGVGQA